MTHRIILAGAGGQGIMILGKIMAEAAMREDRHITWMPSYGAEVRGGTAHCMVIISDQAIGSPIIGEADSLIVMNEPSLERFKARFNNKGLLLVNSSLVSKNKGCVSQPAVSKKSNSGLRCLCFPFTDIAIGLGNIKVANVVALGSFVAYTHILKVETILRVIEDTATHDRKDLIAINKQALSRGMQLVQEGVSDGKG